MSKRYNQLISPPKNGWKPSTYYVVEVAVGSSNPIHKSIFFSGFLTDEGYPNGYNIILSGEGDNNLTIRDIKYMKAIREIDMTILHENRLTKNLSVDDALRDMKIGGKK